MQPRAARFAAGASWAFLCVLSLVGALARAAGDDERFMPKGGRTLLLQTLGAGATADELRSIAQARRSEADWTEFVASRAKALSAREAQTLAAYLSVNMPLSPPALQGGRKTEELAAALPPDGRDLAWIQCQFCHSLFTSHLMQSRDAQGWRNMFQSPFHRELKMTPQEREEFARYSAINMPMKAEDVPPDLRF